MATLKPNRSRLREPCCQTVKEASPPLTANPSRTLFCASRAWFEYLYSQPPQRPGGVLISALAEKANC
jgi:hypothetical protein